MIWQDLVLMISSILFSYALIPQVYNGFKTKRKTIVLQTALITSIGLSATGIAFFSLNLIFSGVTTLVSATLWLMLLIQAIIYKN